MIRADRLVLAGVGLCLAASPAMAQRKTELQTGSRISVPAPARVPEGRDSDLSRTRIIIAEFARCTLDRGTDGVQRAFAMPVGAAYYRAMNRLAVSECLESGMVRIPQTVMRGAIFVELYRRHEKKVGPTVAVPALDFAHPADESERTQLALLAFADCVVKRDAGAARGVVLSPTASADQDQAFRALMPNLGPCLMQGQQITFSKPVLEGALAEVLYREAMTPAAGNN